MYQLLQLFIFVTLRFILNVYRKTKHKRNCNSCNCFINAVGFKMVIYCETRKKNKKLYGNTKHKIKQNSSSIQAMIDLSVFIDLFSSNGSLRTINPDPLRNNVSSSFCVNLTINQPLND